MCRRFQGRFPKGARMARVGAWVGGAALILVAAGCNAPARTQEETRMYPKAPLEIMAPWITPEPTTDMSRLARLNKPAIVEIPVDSVMAPPKK